MLFRVLVQSAVAYALGSKVGYVRRHPLYRYACSNALVLTSC